MLCINVVDRKKITGSTIFGHLFIHVIVDEANEWHFIFSV